MGQGDGSSFFRVVKHDDDLSPDPSSVFPRRDYLADRPVPEVNFERSLFIKHELARIAAGKPMEPFDESRCVHVFWILPCAAD